MTTTSRRATFHQCARCGRRHRAGMGLLVYSRWTGKRFCVDYFACTQRAKRKAAS